MNRNTEYWDLIRDLNETPAALEGTVARARARVRRSKAGKWLGIPVASLGGVAAAFVLLVNCSTPFAMACGRVPVLRELAAAVALSPSLKAAVENDFVQRLDLEQTSNGVTLRLDYMIVDQTQMNVFFTVSGAAHRYEVYPYITDSEGGELDELSSISTGFSQSGELGSFLIDLSRAETMPPAVRLTCKVIDRDDPIRAEAPVPMAETERGDLGRFEEPDPVAAFTFDLALDPRFTAPGETVEMDRWVTLEGQQFHFQTLTIYPTHARLSVAADPDNTAKLVGLDFYLEDDRGNRYASGSRRDGSTLISSGNETGSTVYYLESPYFDRAEHLTLCLTGMEWLDLDRQRVTVDIGRDRALDPMPEGALFGTARRRGADVVVVLFGEDSHNISNWNYWDPEGEEHSFHSMSSTQSDQVWLGGEDYLPVPEGYRSEEFTLPDYPWDTVELGMRYSRGTELEEPIRVVVK